MIIRTLLLCLTAALAGIMQVNAATSAWIEVKGGAVRLISADAIDSGEYVAGVEFLLEPGWHTYWRFPGEAGIAPLFDFDGSANLQGADVRFPAPERYSDGFSTSIVYHERVVLPVRITPVDPARPVDVRLDVVFGVCKDVCVPGDASLSLQLSPGREADRLAAKLIDRDAQRVPVPASDAPPHVTAVRVITREDEPMLEFSAALDSEPASNLDLFVEGPSGSYHGVPTLVSRNGSTAVWHLPARGLKSLPDTTPITVLLIDGDHAVESRHEIESRNLQR